MMEIRAVKFRVDHEWRVGGLFYPSDRQKGPAVLMLHGFPGVQKNEDIAAELCRRGMTVFMPYFKGSWGSSGLYSASALFFDAHAALKLLSRYPQVDSRRIAVLGYSLGGWVALRLAASGSLAAVAAMAPAVPQAGGSAGLDYVRRNGKVLNAPAAEQVLKDYLGAARTDHPDTYLPQIAPTPILFAQGYKDELVPAEATIRLWLLANQPKKFLRFPDEGHDFQNDRASVLYHVCGWIESQLKAKAPAAELPL